MTEPRMPVRTRILRPALWVDAIVARLPDLAFRLYLGLTTCADDDGWLLWRPATLAAQLYRFGRYDRRERVLEKGAAELAVDGLLIRLDCGCAYLPFLNRDFRITGGNHSDAVHRFHLSHAGPDEYVQVSTSPASVSGSVTGSVSGSNGRTSREADAGHFGPEWTPFLAAWSSRGLRPLTLPQRAVLWGEGEDHGAIRDWSAACGRWVIEAPSAREAEVVRHVLDQYHAAVKARQQAPDGQERESVARPRPNPGGPRRRTGPMSLGTILANVAPDVTS